MEPSSLYPLKPLASEKKNIEVSIERINKNLQTATKEYGDIKNAIGRPTLTVGPTYGDLLRMGTRGVLFDIIKQHMYEAVLLVAIRFKWKPEEILALCQIEGLPKHHRKEQETPGNFLSICKVYHETQGWITIYQRSPRNRDEARAWARSRVLWLRWGLDVLIPNEGPARDNCPRTVPQKIHDEKFKDGFENECRSYLWASPFDYFSTEDTSPFEVRKRRNWEFRTYPEYQTAMLALQHSRYKHQFDRIPASVCHRNSIVSIDPIPAWHYLFYNSQNPELHLENMAKRMVNVDHKENPRNPKKFYKGNELYEFFVSTPIPKQVVDLIRKKNNPSAHGYVNALRFEYLRQVYSEVFAGVPVEKAE